MSDAVVPQRCLITLPSTDEFDSRTYRIARTLHERGHHVTVLARRKADQPVTETHPAGYSVVRVDATALDGVPINRLIAPALRFLRLIGDSGATRSHAAPMLNGSAEGATPPPTVDDTDPSGRHGARRDIGGLRAYLRRSRIFLLIRSHQRRALAVAERADIYHGMAYEGVAVALALRKRFGGAVIYDARDIYMAAANLARLRGPIKIVLARMERRWARAADRVVTVNEPYADELARRFGVAPPLVVMNCSHRFAPSSQPPHRFHDRLGLDHLTRVVLYQGGFSPGRGVEQLIAAIRQVPGAVLVIMGYGPLEGVFKNVAASAENRGKVYVLPAVPPTELLEWVSSADVVGVLFQNDTLNDYLSTPNKFFEAMAAGVPSVCSDHPGMGPIARVTGCGIAVPPDDIDGIASAIRSILDAPAADRRALRAKVRSATDQTYNWETQSVALLDEYTRLTGRRW